MPTTLGRFVVEDFETLTLAQIFDQQVGTTASLDATHTKFGVQALKIHKTGAANASIKTMPGALGRVLVGRYWMWLGANPGVSTTISQAQTGLSGVQNVSTAGISTGGFSGVTIASGITVSDSNWHSFDFRLDTRGSTWLYDWMVDGVAQTQATHAASGTEVISQFAFDKVGASTIDYWIDGWQQSDDWGSYPLDDSPFIPPSSNQTVSPPVATAAASALVPVPDLQVPPAAATAAASSPAAVPGVAVPAPVASAAASALVPVPQLVVPPAAATAGASAPVPTVAAGQTVSPPAATASASALVPGVALQVPPAAATASASSPAPTVQLGIPIPVATASASAKIPVPQLLVSPAAATASASAPVPIVTSAPIVGAPAATASASAPLPAIQVQVPAPVATASASGPVPTVTAAIMVLPPVATASASALIPAVKLQVAATLATALASSPLPSFGVTIVLPAAAGASASAKLPTLQLNIAAVSATAAAAAFAPFVTSGGLVFITAPFRSSPNLGVSDSPSQGTFRDRVGAGASSSPTTTILAPDDLLPGPGQLPNDALLPY